MSAARGHGISRIYTQIYGFAELATLGVDATQTDANAAQANLDTNNFI